MVGKEFRDALRSGKNVYGTLITSASPRMFDMTTSLGLDYVFFCQEHIFYNPETLGWMCRVYKAAGINPVVRIPEPSPYLATQVIHSSDIFLFYEKLQVDLNCIRKLKGEKVKTGRAGGTV